MVHRMGGRSVTIFSNSRLVVGQVKSELEAKDERMRGYLTRVQHLQNNFESFDLQIGRASCRERVFLSV